MEEKEKTEEQRTSFIDLGNDPQSAGNIFNELSGELGGLDFDLESEKKKTMKKNSLAIAYAISGYILVFVVVSAIVVVFDLFLRTQSDNSLVGSLPICSYLSWGVENDSNPECKTLSLILSDSTAKRASMEKTLVSNLILLIPGKLQSIDVLSSPKVRFIQEHTGEARVSISDAVDRFNEIKNRTVYQGEDIDCKNMMVNEAGEMTVSCEVYGWALIGPTKTTTTHTSREVALDFMDRLSDERGGFQLLNTPKSLGLNQYSSGDSGIKSMFSTVTTLSLKLRYLPVNKM